MGLVWAQPYPCPIEARSKSSGRYPGFRLNIRVTVSFSSVWRPAPAAVRLPLLSDPFSDPATAAAVAPSLKIKGCYPLRSRCLQRRSQVRFFPRRPCHSSHRRTTAAAAALPDPVTSDGGGCLSVSSMPVSLSIPPSHFSQIFESRQTGGGSLSTSGFQVVADRPSTRALVTEATAAPPNHWYWQWRRTSSRLNG